MELKMGEILGLTFCRQRCRELKDNLKNPRNESKTGTFTNSSINSDILCAAKWGHLIVP
jgi:hypothetical protein